MTGPNDGDRRLPRRSARQRPNSDDPAEQFPPGHPARRRRAAPRHGRDDDFDAFRPAADPPPPADPAPVEPERRGPAPTEPVPRQPAVPPKSVSPRHAPREDPPTEVLHLDEPAKPDLRRGGWVAPDRGDLRQSGVLDGYPDQGGDFYEYEDYPSYDDYPGSPGGEPPAADQPPARQRAQEHPAERTVRIEPPQPQYHPDGYPDDQPDDSGAYYEAGDYYGHDYYDDDFEDDRGDGYPDDYRYRDQDDRYEDEWDHDYPDDRRNADDEDAADNEDERADPLYLADERPSTRSHRRRRRKKSGGRRLLNWVAALVVIALLGGGAWYGIDKIFGYDDFAGDGESDVLIQVAEGDSTKSIAGTLSTAGVTASPKAFVKAAENDNRVLNMQPGYYVLKTKMSGAAAVSKMVAPNARVGQLDIRGGTQLDDIKQPDGKVVDGIYTQLSKASCAMLNGKSTCVPPDELRRVVETGDLAALGVPQWALPGATKAEPKRRIEGLIMPGGYDVRPGTNATELLRTVLTASATRMQATGLGGAPGPGGQTPYQMLVVASIVEKEGVQQDFGKVARVIYNRLGQDQRLEMDSTVNFVLDRPEIRTKDEDRAAAGEYNTYQNKGLPPTPIASASKEAIAAAQRPQDGSWLFFVKCEKNGLSCFSDTAEEHQEKVREAQARGAY